MLWEGGEIYEIIQYQVVLLNFKRQVIQVIVLRFKIICPLALMVYDKMKIIVIINRYNPSLLKVHELGQKGRSTISSSFEETLLQMIIGKDSLLRQTINLLFKKIGSCIVLYKFISHYIFRLLNDGVYRLSLYGLQNNP